MLQPRNSVSEGEYAEAPDAVGDYAEPDFENILVIDDGLIGEVLDSVLNFQKFGVTPAQSFKQAEYFLEIKQFSVWLVNEGAESRKETGSQFVISNLGNSSLSEPLKLVVIAAFKNEVIPDSELFHNSRIKIVRHKSELKDIITKLNDGKYEEIYASEYQNTQEIKNEGVSPHIASDLWTTEDALGYEDYAYSIYRFMTHPKTKPPLTISIQAPWGGGKTSLMRMVRKFIDPDVDLQLKEAARHPNGKLNLKEALEEVKKWLNIEADRKPIQTEEREQLEAKNQEAKKLTVWFNAWKYENTNQVWAGMIDSVMQQVAARLPVKERELFWLRLNLKRVDTDKIRKKVHDRILNYFLRGIWFWIFGLVFVILPIVLVSLGQQFQLFGFIFANISSGISLSFIGTLLLTVGKYLYAKYKVGEEPAVVSLNDYIEIPNYSSEIGFIHRAEIDLKHVLESIPEQYTPLVIFIDDLDRCSPTKISQVVEAVNLFLAGDFPQCMFVIGMDTEMVAAALQSAHKDMIANLPTDLGIPVGWRFMDKFVQLPFLIPPCQRYTKNYVESLFSLNQSANEQVSKDAQQKIIKLVRQRIEQNTSFDKIEESTKNLIESNELTEDEASHFQRNLQSGIKRTIIDNGVRSFTDNNDEIHELMNNLKAFDYFTGNPRELKRFINAFRFNYFLWWAQRSQGSDVVSLEQLLRWTILSMKWAEVIRWLRRGDGSDWVTTPENTDTSKVELVARLKLLEGISQKNVEFEEWKKALATRFQLDSKTTNWINDEDLFRFYRKESELPEVERLSSGFGKGIW